MRFEFLHRYIPKVFKKSWLECPLCGESFPSFSEYSGRRNARCPGCGSLERHRLLWHYLTHRTDLFRRKTKILHFAPEKFLASRLRAMRNLDYLSADLEPGRAMAQMEITDIPSPDNTFDTILCFHVLEHVPDDRKALGELFRVLKPGGWALLQVPVFGGETLEGAHISSPEERRRLFGAPDHVRKYGKDYKLRLEGAGFRVTVESYGEALGAECARKFALKLPDDIYLCEKTLA